MGNQEILKQLIERNFEAWMHTNGFVCFKFKISLGKFKNEVVEIALDAKQFPLNPPSGPYIKPHLLPISGGGGNHPYGAIHDRKLPDSEFQYWSRPLNGWKSGMDMDDYLAFIRTLFDFTDGEV
jgi:hypothetical protein